MKFHNIFNLFFWAGRKHSDSINFEPNDFRNNSVFFMRVAFNSLKLISYIIFESSNHHLSKSVSIWDMSAQYFIMDSFQHGQK